MLAGYPRAFAAAREFASRGAHIALIARGKDGLEATAREVEEAGGRALTLALDVSDAAQLKVAAALVEDTLGPIDIWINNAMTTVFSTRAGRARHLLGRAPPPPRGIRGLATLKTIAGNKLVPGLLDHYLASAAFEGQLSDEVADPGTPSNLFEPVAGDFGREEVLQDPRMRTPRRGQRYKPASRSCPRTTQSASTRCTCPTATCCSPDPGHGRRRGGRVHPGCRPGNQLRAGADHRP